jgi:hypothetical protein
MVSSVKKIGKYVGAIKSASRQLLGKDLSRAVSNRAVSGVAMPAYKMGGVVKKTGIAKVHKGEVVLTVGQRKALKKLLH